MAAFLAPCCNEGTTGIHLHGCDKDQRNDRDLVVIIVTQEDGWKCQPCSAHLDLGALAGVRAGAVAVCRHALTLTLTLTAHVHVHELVAPHRVDEVAQVFVVNVAGQEAGQIHLNGSKTGWVPLVTSLRSSPSSKISTLMRRGSGVSVRTAWFVSDVRQNLQMNRLF